MRVVHYTLITSLPILLCLFLPLIPLTYTFEEYSTYKGTIRCRAAAIFRPKSVREVQAIVKEAIAKNHTVKAIGSRHSSNDNICTDGIAIVMKNLRWVKIEDVDGNKIARVGAGIELMDLLENLNEHGYSLEHFPAFGGITIGGAMGTGAHGSSLLHPTTISELAIGMIFVDAKGKIRYIDREYSDFSAFRVHLGLLGVVVEIHLPLVNQYKVSVQLYRSSEEILFNDVALELARKTDFFQLWWFPSSRSVVVSLGNYTSLDVPGNAIFNLIPDVAEFKVGVVHLLVEHLQALNSTRGMFLFQYMTESSLYKNMLGRPAILSEDGKKVMNPATGYSFNMLSSRCTKCPWSPTKYPVRDDEIAMALPLDRFADIIKDMRAIFELNPVPFPLIGIYFRFSPASDSLMGIETGRETLHIDFASIMRANPRDTPRLGLATYQAIGQMLVDKYDGRPHFGKNGLYYSSAAVASRAYPNLERFAEIVERYDPTGVFMNDYGRRILGFTEQVSMPPDIKHCALEDYCLCSVDEDCAAGQTCGELAGYSVCR
ncbi:uncharacterized protein VTP21DRAFT_10351 [Calcarisporiella thermophila]|uniref:uncharacterized protein n=1 Tax=Calcarisporiella thermophila TaxID=911321 RepID=UPI0037448E84